MSRDIGHRHGSDPALLWLWCRLAAVVPIQPLAWEPPYAMGAALKIKKKKEKKNQGKGWEGRGRRGNGCRGSKCMVTIGNNFGDEYNKGYIEVEIECTHKTHITLQSNVTSI